MFFNDCQGLLEPTLRDQKVVGQPVRSRDSFEIYMTGQKLMELLVIPEQIPNRYSVLGLADPVTEKIADVLIKRRVCRIVCHAFHKVLNALLDMPVSLFDVVRVNGKVVCRVPAKELPCFDIMRVRFDHSFVKAVILLISC